jgi:murein DD-endopeptidase MepM/ murein hydrolase activator NlpD
MTAPAQFPIDGKLGKAWKVTSTMGWRIHPVTKTKKHHNGTDIWAPAEPCWIEAPYAGKVINVGNNPSGFGNSVTLFHKIDGKPYVTIYAHMANGSVKVKKGQKVGAGTPLGKMGSTGMSTGKHLHWELQKGKTLVWNATGKNYIEPVAFFKALIAKEKAIATAPVETPPDAPVAPAPTHDDKGAAELAKTEAAAAAVVSAPAAPKARPAVKVGSKGVHVKYLQKKLGITPDGIFGPDTKKHVMAFQEKNDLKVDGTVGPNTWAKIG